MPKYQARLTGQAIKITLPAMDGEPAAETLIVEVAIDCPQCGSHRVRFAGHHLRALRDLFIEFIDLHPTLTGEEAGIEVVNRLQFGGQGGSDPSMN